MNQERDWCRLTHGKTIETGDKHSSPYYLEEVVKVWYRFRTRNLIRRKKSDEDEAEVTVCTDGSKINWPAVMPLLDGKVLHRNAARLADYCSVFQAEA